MFKNSLALGVVAGILSGLACTVFAYVYKEAVTVDFSPVISTFNYFGACLFACVLASLGFYIFNKVLKKYGEIIFNILFIILSFASILFPLMYSFPPDLEVKDVDMITSYFQPFAMTLHFFPALIWFAVKPIFIK